MAETPDADLSAMLTALAQAATNLHEMYGTLRAAGFTDEQALYLVACAITGGPKTPPTGEPHG